MEWPSVDEERHRTSSPPSSIVTSVPDIGTEPDLGFQRLDAENDELLAHQPLREALVIELVFVRGKVEQVLTPVGNPLPWTLGPEPGQVVFKGAQGLLPQIRLMLDGHIFPFPLRCWPNRSRSRDPHSTRKSLSTDRVHRVAQCPPIGRRILASAREDFALEVSPVRAHSTPCDRGGRPGCMLGSARLEPRDLLLHLIDQALERPQGHLLDVGIVSRILANRLISRLERT